MQEFIPASHDVVFKALFVRKPDLLRSFLRDTIGLPLTNSDKVDILNPELIPSYPKGKLSRLDVHVETGGHKVNVEMQSRKHGFSAERVLYYWARMFSSGEDRGELYENLEQTISVNVLGFCFLDCQKYHSSYSILEDKRHEQLTDRLSIHIFELPKVPKDLADGSDQEMWLQLIRANSEEALKMIRESTQNVMIQKAIETVEEINADKALREQIFQRDKAMRDYDNDMALARAEGEEEGEARGIAIGEERGIAIGEERGIAIGEERGIAKNRVETVLKFMQATGKTQKEVLSILGISEEEYNQSLELLQE